MNQNMTEFTTTNVEIVLSTIFLILVNLGIIVGNSVMLMVVWRTRDLHRPNYYFLSSLGVADLLVGLFYCPLLIASVLNQNWIFGMPLCRAHAFAICLTLNASLMSLAAISVDRYFFITKPLKHSRIFSARRTAVIVCLLWMHSLFWALAPLLGWGLYTFEDSTDTCKPNWQAQELYHKSYALGLGLSCFVLPVVVMVWAYVAIYKAAKSQARRIQIPISERVQWKATQRRKYKPLFTVLIIIGLFFLCWSIFTVVNVWKLFAASTDKPPYRLVRVGLYLAISNSSVNFYVYALRDRIFREGLRRLFGCYRRSRSIYLTTTPATSGQTADWFSMADAVSPQVGDCLGSIGQFISAEASPPTAQPRSGGCMALKSLPHP